MIKRHHIDYNSSFNSKPEEQSIDKRNYYERGCENLPKYHVNEGDMKIPACPYISGDTFRSFSNLVFDETTPQMAYSYKAERIRKNNLVFVATHYLREVEAAILTNTREPFILITSNSDDPAPSAYPKLLNFKYLIAWFAQNVDMAHEKVYPLPIGIANYKWGHGNITLIKHIAERKKPFHKRQTLLYVNMNAGTDRSGVRATLEKRFSSFSNVKILNGRVLYKEYLEHLQDAKFVLSPRGNGLDCHRTWESMIMGAVPIILSSEMDKMFFNVTNVIILKTWEELNEEMLTSFKPDFQGDGSDIIYAKYWYDKISSRKVA
ncbi:hypothetical protein O9G_004592 [Rozella allomycis CSF55]|uniref:Exostosin GT47 domain-containing protein n=1 Tax=Rozella allomycis (strain CSF55) TaxID=988480 RepID=A0A075B2H8_ROZAC|nr:hypothetical protein O9G_004592 [Rozella allomycis CSF55]|eukprot:EPZ36800.1 hypothetical protein O9G_004592 [Rozella allomycis CSF55]